MWFEWCSIDAAVLMFVGCRQFFLIVDAGTMFGY
jgi:hypothetical protein